MPGIPISSARSVGKAGINFPVCNLLKIQLNVVIIFIVLFQLFGISYSTADTLSIATASNFRPVLEQLSEAFSRQQNIEQKNSGVTTNVSISSASSGVLYAQILQGAPFQLFFSANTSYPKKLVDSGHGSPETLATYAMGKLILVSRKKDPGVEDETPEKLLADARRIAIANPRTAPYGVAAMAVLERLGVAETGHSRLVMGNNIAQAWQFFHSGNADVAIVAASLIYPAGQSGFKENRFVTIDLSSYLTDPVEQALVAIKPVGELTRQFLDFLKTPVAAKMIADGGYWLPVAAPAPESEPAPELEKAAD